MKWHRKCCVPKWRRAAWKCESLSNCRGIHRHILILVDAWLELTSFSSSPKPQEPCQMGNNGGGLETLPLWVRSAPLAFSLSNRIGPHFNDTTGFWRLFEAVRYSACARQVYCWDVTQRKCSSTPLLSCCLPKIGIIPAAQPPSQCHSSFKWPNVRKRSGPGSELCGWSPTGQVSFCSVSFDTGHVMVCCSSACIP